MLIYIFLCSVLFIPIHSGNNISAITGGGGNINLTSKDLYKTEPKQTKVTVVPSEGGPIVQTTPAVAKQNENNTLLSLDREFIKDKSIEPSNSKVKPRKGVNYSDDNPTTPQTIHSVSSQNITTTSTVKDTSTVVTSKPKSASGVVTKSNHTNKTDEKLNEHPASIIPKKTEGIKKPLILSDIALAKASAEAIKDQLKISAIQTSSKSVVADQMPLPRLQIHAKANSHPGMVMPVVITILVVPMFAVLGYMALKRGKEAWKNRHYKRMDFLLDGMYND